jgi:glycosyl transferase family 25
MHINNTNIIIIILILCIITITAYLSVDNEWYDFYETYDWSMVDKVVYINLKERKDRRKQIENELTSKISSNKIFRFEAIRDSPGHIGCTKSHIAVLETAIRNDWKNVLIVEDDAMFHNYKKSYKTLKRLMNEHPDFDVITLGNVSAQYDRNTLRLFSGQTTTAYLVNRPYFETLLRNFKEGLEYLLPTKNMEHPERSINENKYAIDQYWKHLQKKDNWYIVHPALMIQRADKSDINGVNVDYSAYFNL